MSGEEIKMALEVVNTLAIVIASVVAIYGIKAWRKEFQGKRKIELAEEVLALFYEAKDAIRAIRNFLSYPSEGAAITPQQCRDSAIVYERYEKRQGIFNKLGSKRYQFKARFGVENDKPFEDLKNIIIDIQVAADGLSMILRTSHNTENTETQKKIEEYQSKIQSHHTNDPIKPRIEKVISDIEAICRPIIMGSSKYP